MPSAEIYTQYVWTLHQSDDEDDRDDDDNDDGDDNNGDDNEDDDDIFNVIVHKVKYGVTRVHYLKEPPLRPL